jgi:hypothetical protein
MPVWSHNYGNMITPADHKPWSLERCPGGLPSTHAAMRRRHMTGCRKEGHDWSDPRNVRHRSNGRRYCAECDRERSRAYHARLKAARSAVLDRRAA